MMNRNKNVVLLFLIGLGSQTQFHFIGSLGISELPIFILAPLIFLFDYGKLKNDGFLTILWLTLLCCLMCGISAMVNHSIPILLIKTEATYYSLFAYIVVLHRLLRNNFSGLKWLLIGLFFSSIISVFAFQQETYTSWGTEKLSADEAAQAVIGNPLFWSSRISSLLRLPVEAFYMNMPLSYSVMVPLICAIIYMLFSQGSGRSAAMVSLLGTVLIFLGRKSRMRMRMMGKKIVLLGLILFVMLIALKFAYQFAATNGILGDKAQEKYERQTSRGTGVLKILMAGRVEFFVTLRAALDKPIIGHGPRPVDKKGYLQEYLSKYGTHEDYEIYMHNLMDSRQRGFEPLLPEHSAIASSWLNAGIVGLLLWLYVMYLDYKYVKCYASAVPQWFGYIVLAISGQAWHIFFSGYGNRWTYPITLVCVLFARAVAMGKIRLPIEMELEARRCE